MSAHILIVEDDERLAQLVSTYLKKQGYIVNTHSRGDTAETAIQQLAPDLIILDVMLPGKSGFDICRDIRSGFSGLILIMTANEDHIDEIIGLELGADDYVAKPVEPRLLLARVRALLRRKQIEPADNKDNDVILGASVFTASSVMPVTELHFGSLHISAQKREVIKDRQAIDFTTAEFDLLWLLASHAGTVLSRDDILNKLRGINFDGLDRSIDARISRLRKKLLDDPDRPKLIKTVRGKGYLFMYDDGDFN